MYKIECLCHLLSINVQKFINKESIDIWVDSMHFGSTDKCNYLRNLTSYKVPRENRTHTKNGLLVQIFNHYIM